MKTNAQVSAEERDPFREVAVIDNVFYGLEDHGTLTCIVGLWLGPQGGSHQSFGCLALDDHNGPDFARELCAAFGVVMPAVSELFLPTTYLKMLVGKKCWALRCFDEHSSTIEGLEAEDGRHFVLTDWRRRHFPETQDPLETAARSIASTIKSLQRRLDEERGRLATLAEGYRPVTGMR